MIIVYAQPYIPHPPSLPPSLVLSNIQPQVSMYNHPSTQRNFLCVARLNSAQGGEALECLRGYILVQERSTSLGMSSTCEAVEQGNNMFGLGSTGGGDVYGCENSASLRHVSIIVARAYEITHLYAPKSPSDSSFHVDWEGEEDTPPTRPYSRQSNYHHVNLTPS